MMKKEKIRIMHIAQAAGGVDRYLRMLLKYFDKDKFENVLVCSYDYDEKSYEGIVNVFEQVEMRRSICWQDLIVAISVRKLIKKYKPDIVYAHSSKAGAIARLANIGIRNKCIYNPHGWAFNMQGSKMKKAIYVVLEKIMALFCDKIVCISGAEQLSALTKRICSEKRLQVIYNGIDVETYNISEHSFVYREELGIPKGAFVVGMVGRLCPQKAPDVFIRMAKEVRKQIPNAHFLFVGDGEMRDEVIKFAEENEILEAIHITGWVNNPLNYVELFDVAVLLSRWEGFGLAIPEYMVCRKPIIATAVDAIPNVITDHVNGLLVPKDDSEAASNAVIELYKDSNMRERLIAQGVRDVYKKYDVRRVTAEHERLFLSIIS